LTEEEIKEKRRQRLMKAGWEARVKAREEKRKEKEKQASHGGVEGRCLLMIIGGDQEERRGV
jgi:hypothetical protein